MFVFRDAIHIRDLLFSVVMESSSQLEADYDWARESSSCSQVIAHFIYPEYLIHSAHIHLNT